MRLFIFLFKTIIIGSTLVEPLAMASQVITQDVLIFTAKDESINPLAHQAEFAPIASPHFNISYTSEKTWFKIPKSLLASNVNSNYLTFTSSVAGKMDMYVVNGSQQLEKIAQSGSGYHRRERQIGSLNVAFEVPAQFMGNTDIFISHVGRHLFDGKIILLSQPEWQEKETARVVVLSMYFGALLVLIAYCLSLFLIAKQKVYIWYALFLGAVGMNFATLLGVTDSLVDITDRPFNDALLVFSCTSVFTGLQFGSRFLSTKDFLPRGHRWLNFLSIAALFLVFSYPLSSKYCHTWAARMTDTLILLSVTSLVIVAAYCTYKKHPQAHYYLASWVVMAGAVVVYYSSYFGLRGESLLWQHSLLFGNLAEMLILSVALASQMRDLEAKKVNAEVRAYDRDRFQRIVRVLAHDIANPLAIMTMTAMKVIKDVSKVENGTPQTEKTIKDLKRIQKAGTVMAALLDRVRRSESLDHAKALVLEPVNIEGKIKEAEFLLQEKLNAKDIRLEIRPIQGQVFILAEPTAFLNDILVNIISNAIKFSEPKSAIKIDVTEGDRLVTISIADQGFGISRENLLRLQELGGLQSTAGTAGESGTGLGLPLIKSYVELCQGTVEITSKARDEFGLDSGTTFRLKFNVAAVETLKNEQVA